MGSLEGAADAGSETVAESAAITIDSLIALELAITNGDVPAITDKGRKVLIRGSSLLLQDLAA